MLQGIALAGFNVVDVEAIQRELGVPVLVIARRKPRLDAMRAALQRVPGGERKWRLIERAGPMERIGPVFVQRCGVTEAVARATLEAVTLHGNLPEPVRLAHLIAGGIGAGRSRGRA